MTPVVGCIADNNLSYAILSRAYWYYDVAQICHESRGCFEEASFVAEACFDVSIDVTTRCTVSKHLVVCGRGPVTKSKSNTCNGTHE